MGKSETKSNWILLFLDIKELLPDIIQHLGPKQFNMLKDIMS
jgi:hypothetical protein